MQSSMLRPQCGTEPSIHPYICVSICLFVCPSFIPFLACKRAWKQLPTELKRTKLPSAFRRRLKTFHFDRTYCSE